MIVQKINKIYRKSETIAMRLTRKDTELNSIDFEETLQDYKANKNIVR